MKPGSIVVIIFTFINICFSQYSFQTAISGLNQPTVFAFMPSSRIIVNQKGDSSKIFNSTNGQFISCFWNFRDSLYINPETGVMGVCLDPNFNSNHYVYICYTHGPDSTTRVIRLTENNNQGTNPFVVARFKRPGVNFAGPHMAGNIRFGPLSKLYVSIGDAGQNSNAQLLTNPLGKIHRINPDGTIPADNPFYDDNNPLTGNDDRIWAYGLRNGWDFTFSPFNDSLYLTENGQTANDEINFIRKGKNYGWPICQGYCIPYNPLYRQPMDTIWGPGGTNYAPTGILVYNGMIYPELAGKIIVIGVGAGIYSGILKCEPGNPPFNDTISSHILISPQKGTTLLQGPDNYIYICSIFTGAIIRMIPPLGIINNSEPSEFTLEQNYPNPFNPVTSIKYSISKQSFVTLQIFDALGREINLLINESKQAGNYEITWDADAYPSGVYFYRLTANEFTLEKKMILLK